MGPRTLAKLAGIAVVALLVAIAPACKKAPGVQKHIDRALDEAKLRTDVREAANQDGEIREQLNALVQSDDRWKTLRDRDINFEVTHGTVTITGEVASERQKARAGDIVRDLPGVRDVANALQVKRPAKLAR